MTVGTVDPVLADLLMVEANMQVARHTKDGSLCRVESLDLINRILPHVPVGRRTPGWRAACEYLERDSERFELANR